MDLNEMRIASLSLPLERGGGELNLATNPWFLHITGGIVALDVLAILFFLD
jgi:hypothetical protein